MSSPSFPLWVVIERTAPHIKAGFAESVTTRGGPQAKMPVTLPAFTSREIAKSVSYKGWSSAGDAHLDYIETDRNAFAELVEKLKEIAGLEVVAVDMGTDNACVYKIGEIFATQS